MDYQKFIEYINFIAIAHQEETNQFGKTKRKLLSGQEVPYFTHSLWAAIMLLIEPNLDEEVRTTGSIALLFHDVLEDTTAGLPRDLDENVVELIQGMTVPKEPEFNFSSFEKEKTTVFTKSKLIQLLKLYDKVATLYDGALPTTRYKEWITLIERLTKNVEQEYGELRITMLAKSLVDKYRSTLSE